MRDFRKVDMDDMRQTLERKYKESPANFMELIKGHQIMVYVMVGGGMIGQSHAEQPAYAYVDSRVSKRPYPVKHISQATKILAMMAEVAGLDPNDMPKMINIFGCGIF